MKVLVNGGLNLSSLDGWWAEAYEPDVGWAIGDASTDDASDAEVLYRQLEHDVVPEFYDRDASGVARRWVARIRASMSRLAPQFSSNRMLLEYVRDVYQPAARTFQERAAAGGALGVALAGWAHRVRHRWREIHIADFDARREGDALSFRVHVYLGDLESDAVQVQIYAEQAAGDDHVVVPMQCVATIPGAVHAHVYACRVATARPATDFTPRVVPYHPSLRWPLELPLVHWRGG
jgi:starch phosphorylase